jgi:UDP-glucose 4-epimerase
MKIVERQSSARKSAWIQGSRCLVTGGAGFIGSHLVRELQRQGAIVQVLDDLSTGKRSNLDPGTNLLEGSVTDRSHLCKAMSGQDFVFHLAAIPSVPRSIENPERTARVNIWGTLEVLEAARRAGVKRLVYSSSSSIYGGITHQDARKESECPRPLSPYAAQKLSGEQLCVAYGKSMGVSTVSLRYFNIFGPGQDPESPYAAVIPKFICAAMGGNEILVHGDGEQSRDFTHVSNAVHANILAVRPDPSLSAQIFNVGCGENYSLNHLIALIEKFFDAKITRAGSASRPGDVRFSRADIGAARLQLGYEPLVSFADGLADLCKWFQEARGDSRIRPSA